MEQSANNWTFFSNHGHVYFLLANNESITLREIALKVDITERSVTGIISDLYREGYIDKEKVGRTNIYRAIPEKRLKHPLESNVKLSDLNALVRKANKKMRSA